KPMNQLIKIFSNLKLVVSVYPILIQILIWGFLINLAFVFMLSIRSLCSFKAAFITYKTKIKHPSKQTLISFFKDVLTADILLSDIQIKNSYNTKINPSGTVDWCHGLIALSQFIRQNPEFKSSLNYKVLVRAFQLNNVEALSIGTLTKPLQRKLIEASVTLGINIYEDSHLFNCLLQS